MLVVYSFYGDVSGRCPLLMPIKELGSREDDEDDDVDDDEYLPSRFRSICVPFHSVL